MKSKKKVNLIDIITYYTMWYIIIHYKIEDSMTLFTDNPQPLQPRTPEEIKEIKERLRGKNKNDKSII